MPSDSEQPDLSLSIVSHGQGALVHDLLSDLTSGLEMPVEIILTINIPEDEAFFGDLNHPKIKIVRNASAKGFGSNHNAAFKLSRGRFFAVVNPDIRMRRCDFNPLLTTLAMPRVGACGPMVLSPNGEIEDNARNFPTFAQLARRVLTGVRVPDYAWQRNPIDVDWLAGMFIVFNREAFSEVGGFDERFFMYFEDADICRRLRQLDWKTVLNPSAVVIHHAQRASRRSPKHLRWHVRSAFRYLTGH